MDYEKMRQDYGNFIKGGKEYILVQKPQTQDIDDEAILSGYAICPEDTPEDGAIPLYVALWNDEDGAEWTEPFSLDIIDKFILTE